MWDTINGIIKGERKPQEYSLEVNGKVISDLEEVSEDFANHFAAVGERIHAEYHPILLCQRKLIWKTVVTDVK